MPPFHSPKLSTDREELSRIRSYQQTRPWPTSRACGGLGHLPQQKRPLLLGRANVTIIL